MYFINFFALYCMCVRLCLHAYVHVCVRGLAYMMLYCVMSNMIMLILLNFIFLINNATVTGFAKTETCVIHTSNFDDSQCVGMTGRCDTFRDCRISSYCFRLYFMWFSWVIYKSIIAPPCLLITLTFRHKESCY